MLKRSLNSQTACTGVIFSTLCKGGTLVVSDTSDLIECAKMCNKLPATPSILNVFRQPEDFKNVEEVYLGGESPGRLLIQQWSSPTRRILNAYGPTETTCASTIAELRMDLPVVLGSTMPNSQLLLLNRNLEEVEEGEICISGPGLAAGYFKNETLTKERFIDWNGVRIYRTGDFGRKTKHGIEFMGRQDSLVKNRGFLVNLESQVVPALRAYPGVTAATAFMYRGKLLAYITPATFDPKKVRLRLSSHLDGYLVPDQIRTLETMPLSPNGKTDDRILRDALEIETSQVHPAANSKLEILKAGVSMVLSLSLEEIPDDQSFWSLGGNSLSAVKLLSYLHTQRLSISLAQIFQLQDLRAVSEALSSQPSERPATNGPSLDRPENRGREFHEPPLIAPMTTLQIQMARSILSNPILNYLIVSMTFHHTDEDLPSQRLEHAWRTVLHRHSIFRTAFDLGGGFQRVQPDMPFDWQELKTEPEAWNATHEEASKGLYGQLRRTATTHNIVQPLISFKLITLPHQKSSLLWLVHHSQIDGWSLSVITKEIQAALDGRELAAAPQFLDIVFAQEKQMKAVERDAEVFWTRVLDRHLPPPPLTLPRPEAIEGLGQKPEERLGMSITLPQLEQSARLFQVSSATIVYTTWAILLSRYCSSDRILFGATLSGRSIPMPLADTVVGPLLNTCPFSVYLPAGCRKADVLSGVYSRLLQMHDFQWSAYETTERLAAGSHTELLSTIVTIEYDLPGSTWDCEILPGPCKLNRQENPEAGLSLSIGTENDEIILRLQYESSRYEAAAIKRLLVHFQNIFNAMLDPSCSAIEDVCERMIDPSEVRSLTQAGSSSTQELYKGPISLKDAIEAAADQWPHLVAVEGGRVSMTYRQLDEASTAIANHLVTLVKPGEIIGILSDGSLHWVLSVVSVIKVGAVCAPIDVQLPSRRVQTIIQEANISFCLLPGHQYEDWLHFGKLDGLFVDDFLKAQPRKTARLPTLQRATDTAYLVFTSGSTGVPKGVRVSHIGILSLLTHPPARLHAGPRRRIAQAFSVGFDGCTAEIFGSLTYGATLVLKDPTDPFFHLESVDSVMATPSLLATLPASDLQNLETVVFLGEAVPQGLADTWADGRRLYNAYGPCECAFLSTIAPLPSGRKVTLGNAVPRMNVRLLDAQKRLVPVGIVGEICLSGIQVSPGYLGLEEVNKARFTQDPFASQQKMYRTGDLGVWTESMELQFVGRIDNQVKVRGFRIELEEVEQAILSANATIRHAVAIARDDYLYGFFAPQQDIDVKEISENLSSTLPFYSQPTQIIGMPFIPLSPNHKVDRKALEGHIIKRTRKGREPSTPTEKVLAKIWNDLLSSDGSRDIGVEDDFMCVGGNSLLQIKTAQRVLEAFGTRIPLGIIIRNTKLAQLASAIDESIASDEYQPLGSIASKQHLMYRRGTAPLSHLEEEMYAVYETSSCKSAYHMACQLEFEGILEPKHLSGAINSVFSNYAIFRARYIYSEGIISRQTSPEVLPAQYYDASVMEPGFLDSEINRPFDLAKEQPVRAFVVRKSDRLTSLLLVMHHIVADKQTLISLLQKIQYEYTKILGIASFEEQVLQETAHYHHNDDVRNYAEWAQQDMSLKIPELESAKVFWKQYLHDLPPKPLSENGYLIEQNDGTSRSFSVGRFQRSSNSQQLAVAAVVLMTHIAFGVDDVLIGMPYMDRLEHGASDMLGLFLDRVVTRLELNKVDMTSAVSLLGAVKTNVQDALSNYIPYRQVCETAGKRHLFDVMVTYHWRDDSPEKQFQLPGIGTSSRPVRTKGAKFPIMYEFTETEDGLFCEVEYNTNLVSENTVDMIQKDLPELLDGLHSSQGPKEMISGLMQYHEHLQVASLHERALKLGAIDKQTVNVTETLFAEA